MVFAYLKSGFCMLNVKKKQKKFCNPAIMPTFAPRLNKSLEIKRFQIYVFVLKTMTFTKPTATISGTIEIQNVLLPCPKICS
jgi:hypothetical protein